MEYQDRTFAHVEWEWLGEPAVFKDLQIEAPVSLNIDQITIERDLNYSLYATIEIQNKSIKQESLIPLVHANSPITFSFSIKSNTQSLVLSNCECIHDHRSYNAARDSSIVTLTYLPEKIDIASQTQTADQKVGWLTDWYLNGIHRSEIYSGFTQREFSQTLRRQRFDGQTAEEWDYTPITGGSISGSRDFFVIPHDRWKILVTRIPDGIGPEWSKNIGIEYLPDDDGCFPSDQERTAISELVSFFFGKDMVRVGSTTFDDSANFISRTSYQKMYFPYPRRSAEAGLPPVSYSTMIESGGFGVQIARLLPKFFELRADVQISDIFWHLWRADQDSLDSKIPTYVRGIEHLAKNWFRSQHSSVKGVYMAKQDYEALITQEIESLYEKFKSIEDGEKIINKISTAFQMSGNDRILRFLDEIGLTVGDVERDVIRNRNKYSHGHSFTSDEEINEALKFSFAARSLFDRIILKMLNYSGHYVDYYLEGHPMKDLETPLGV